MMHVLRWSRSSRLGRSKWWLLTLVLAALGLVASVRATPPLGFIVNEILSMGVAERGINQHVHILKNPDGTISPWLLQLQVLGDTDSYTQHLVLAPGGYSGWHSHPGLLVGTVKSGQINFYDEDCERRTVAAGQVYTENDKVHAISNTGPVDADLYISYLIKHGQPRRREESAPACAVGTGIP
jgi:quercetin dioxygenase-like cupin family protein